MSPQKTSPMKQEMSILGIDIAKRVLHAVGLDERGKIVFRKRLSRHDLIPFIAKLLPGLIGMEACGGAHYWARRFRAADAQVRRSPWHPSRADTSCGLDRGAVVPP